MELIDILIKEGWLKTERIISAFRKIKRKDFLPEDIKDLSEINEALSIGWSQTISQPLVVAFMLELLQPEAGEKILDVGSGSGWTSALLAFIVSGGERKGTSSSSRPCRGLSMESEQARTKTPGRVIALEIITELKEFGEKNVAKYDFVDSGVVEFVCADGSKGYPERAPFDKILASASAQAIPLAWKKQLRIGGRIVAPLGSSIWLATKKSENQFEEVEYPGFAFVPLVSE